MAPRTRMTPFARLLLFLLVFLPLAYIGAAYYNGEDPLAKIKTWFGGQTTTSAPARSSNTSGDCAQRLEALERENYQLKQELLEKSEELRRLKAGSSSSSGNGTRQKWGN